MPNKQGDGPSIMSFHCYAAVCAGGDVIVVLRCEVTEIVHEVVSDDVRSIPSCQRILQSISSEIDQIIDGCNRICPVVVDCLPSDCDRLHLSSVLRGRRILPGHQSRHPVRDLPVLEVFQGFQSDPQLSDLLCHMLPDPIRCRCKYIKQFTHTLSSLVRQSYKNSPLVSHSMQIFLFLKTFSFFDMLFFSFLSILSPFRNTFVLLLS